MKIGIITIGQLPRNDVVREIGELLDRVGNAQRGCLDELASEQIESLKP